MSWKGYHRQVFSFHARDRSRSRRHTRKPNHGSFSSLAQNGKSCRISFCNFGRKITSPVVKMCESCQQMHLPIWGGRCWNFFYSYSFCIFVNAYVNQLTPLLLPRLSVHIFDKITHCSGVFSFQLNFKFKTLEF